MSNPHRLITSTLLLITLILTSTATAKQTINEPPSIEQTIRFTDWLLLPKVGQSGRIPFPSNPVINDIVHGTWQPPQPGDTITSEPGKQVIWTQVTGPQEGALSSALLLGGWAHTTITVDTPQRAILRAKGHSVAYVNGVPRVTNVYRYGYSMIPVALNAGDNHFLFKCVRFGTIEAQLELVTHDIMINMDDATLPEAVRGTTVPFDAGIVVINTTTRAINLADAQGNTTDSITLPSYWMPPLSIAKVPVTLPATLAEGESLQWKINGDRIQPAEITVPIVGPDDFRKVTFRSDVEGSVQYYGYRPRSGPDVPNAPSGLMLHLHGASDEAFAYRNLYLGKPWCAIASATNRRPYGFNWEEWGRIDVLEVLQHARHIAKPDPARIYLGGHSMGGHGVWINGVIYPDQFAALGPGAGWQSVWTYTSSDASNDQSTDLKRILETATSASRPELLANNYLQQGVLIIHGDADRVVSINEAYAMRDLLESVNHDDWTMVIESGGGHVYDTTPETSHSCFDLLELFDFFQYHTIPYAPRRVDFTTVSPWINDSCHWLRIEQQIQQHQPSRAQLQIDPGRRWLFGSLENIQRFSIDPSRLIEPGTLTIQFDEEEEREIKWHADSMLHFQRDANNQWQLADTLNPSQKGPHRNGMFRTAFMANHPILVIATNGTPEENKWALEKARFDNETMWYRGNASFQMMFDHEFDPTSYPDRNVVLYGNAETNLAWNALMKDSPINVKPGELTVGEHQYTGDDLACFAVQPRPDSDIACIGLVSGTGPVGMRAGDVLPIFSAGVNYPDFVIFRADAWQKLNAAVLAAGYFGNNWSIETGQCAFTE